jgi:phosphatidate cytidylyltransferase
LNPVSNLATRVLVALIGIPLILLLTMAGGFAFFLLIAGISTLGLLEFFRLARERGTSPQTGVGIAFGLAVNAVFFHNRLQYVLLDNARLLGVGLPLPSMPQAFLIIFLLFVPLVLLVEVFRNRPSPARNIGATLFGVLYIPVFLGALIGLRELFVPADFPVYLHFSLHGVTIPPEVRETIYQWGGFTVVALFAAIWVCDSAAYFVGTRFGRHKLLERVSPKKTWEGAIAGCVGAILAFVAARALLLPYMSLTTAIVCGLIVGVFGQLGDMVESLIKRDAGVKDSSGLIPGHGGLLDRFDSLIFVSPLIYFYLDFVVF